MLACLLRVRTVSTGTFELNNHEIPVAEKEAIRTTSPSDILHLPNEPTTVLGPCYHVIFDTRFEFPCHAAANANQSGADHL